MITQKDKAFLSVWKLITVKNKVLPTVADHSKGKSFSISLEADHRGQGSSLSFEADNRERGSSISLEADHRGQGSSISLEADHKER